VGNIAVGPSEGAIIDYDNSCTTPTNGLSTLFSRKISLDRRKGDLGQKHFRKLLDPFP
jgi:hypothetical protein